MLFDWNSINSYDPLLTGSSLLRGVFFFYPLYAKHSCFYLEQLPTSSSSSLGLPPLFQVTDSRSLAAHNSFIHSLNRYLLHTYYVPGTVDTMAQRYQWEAHSQEGGESSHHTYKHTNHDETEAWGWELERGISERRNNVSKTLRQNGVWFEEVKKKDLVENRKQERE